jgi:aerobic carbon-monoxide dehydrogenase large subunit
MNARIPSADFSAMKFGVGQTVRRNEDPILVSGQGRYTDDVSVAGQLYAAFVRSPHAHGLLRSVDGAAALAMKGVMAVFTGKDLEGRGYGILTGHADIPGRNGTKIIKPAKTALAVDKVRFAGEAIAMVVAKTAVQARDAAEAVAVDIEPLPVVTTMDEAMRPGAPQLFDEAPGNVILDYQFGDPAQVEAAFAAAHHVTRLRIVNSRVVINAMEPRSAIAEFDRKSGRFTLNVQSQGAFGMRAMIASLLGVGTDKVRILTGNVGGSFGMKISPFPEYLPLLHAARELGKPVKWTDSRSESYLSDHHGRDMIFDAELALDKQGRFLATRYTCLANMGGYLTPFAAVMPTMNVPKNSIGMYRTPLVEVRTKCVMTNTVPIGAYRGAGRPESNYCMERLVEAAAAEMGIDSVALRKRNLIKPSQIPYTTPAATTYDTGDFPALLEQALKASDWTGYAARKRASKKAGKLRGRGIGCYLEVTGPPANEMGGISFEEDGGVTLTTGTLDFGQGHWSAFAQVLTTKLGVPFDKIRLVQGDSDQLVAGNGTGGSKSIMSSGKAIVEASDIIIERGKAISAHVLEAAVGDMAFANGRFSIAGTDKSIGVMELAAKLRGGLKLPKGLPQSLDVKHVIKPSLPAYPNGCHVCEVEIDPDTGVTRVVGYVMVNDFGTLINPMIVEGQMHGGVVQGIGQAIYEMTTFDESGQLLTGSFMDYCMPRADDVPFFTFENQGIPATTNPLGAKGCGEAGCAGSMPSVMNAIIDALKDFGVRHVDMPATPEKVWRLVHGRA